MSLPIEERRGRDEELRLFAPLDGLLVPLESVPDPVFSQKLLGEGIAIDPTNGLLRAPCRAQVTLIHRARHAVTLSAGGASVLLHVGLDTIKLNGKGFELHVAQGQEVAAGQPLLSFDLDLISRRARSALTAIVVTDSPFPAAFPARQGSVVSAVDEILRYSPELAAPQQRLPASELAVRSAPFVIHAPNGVHARPAARVVARARELGGRARLHKGDRSARCTSVTELMALEIAQGETVWLSADGEGAAEAISALQSLLTTHIEPESATHEMAPTPVPRPSVTAGHNDVVVGLCASPGSAIGEVTRLRGAAMAELGHSGGVTNERTALREAVQKAQSELAQERARFAAQNLHERAEIFAAHAELLADEELIELALAAVDAGENAAVAWGRAIDAQCSRLQALKDVRLRQRADDIQDVGARVVRWLIGGHLAESYGPRAVLLADVLLPSQIAHLQPGMVAALVSATGGATSHAAIIARSIGVPYVAGVGAAALARMEEGTTVLVDADEGKVHLKPSDDTVVAATAAIAERASEHEQTARRAQHAAVTLDAHTIEVAANIGDPYDAARAVQAGADGVGLLRSEVLFLERRSEPSEDEQARAMLQVAIALGPRRTLVVRTLDIGGDKPLPYLPLATEENPFLGVRGIRVSQRYPESFDLQLRAILRAAPHAHLHVMFPMVAELDEFLAAKRRLLELAALQNVTRLRIGVMVEVPSVAVLADLFAPHVDFFSVGTNDLTQYTLAMDRGHPELGKRADALSPAVLRLIKGTADAAASHGKWAGVCGGVAADPLATPLLLGVGIRELSVPIPDIGAIKARVRELSLTGCAALADQALSLKSAEAVRELLREFWTTVRGGAS